jgi:hypothetical protein
MTPALARRAAGAGRHRLAPHAHWLDLNGTLERHASAHWLPDPAGIGLFDANNTGRSADMKMGPARITAIKIRLIH